MKIKIAIVGMAYRATAFLGELKQRNDCDLVACCDKYPSRMRYMAERFGLSSAAFYTDFRECLNKSDFDAVMVFTPDGSHADIVVPCLKAGKYVFVEKPLEITEKKCLEIVQADQCAGGKTYVGHNLRHAPLYKRIKALMDEGVLGEVLTIQADEFYDGGRTYFRRWNRLKRNGGGLWITKACHDFDLLQWLAGTPPLAVAASSALSYYRKKDSAAMYCGDCALFKNCADAFDETRYPKDWMDHIKSAIPDGLPRPDLCLFNSDKDTFDHGMATVRFQRDILATYTVNVVAGFTNRTIRISGTRATVDGDLERQALTVRHRDPARTETFTLMDPALAGVHGGADQSVISDFLSFVRGEKPPAVDPSEAVIAVKMGLAAEKSCATGRWVTIRSHNDAALS